MSRPFDPNHFERPNDHDNYGAHAAPHAGAYARQGHGMSAAQAIPAERMAFIRRTYMHLVGAIFAFVALVAVFFTTGVAAVIIPMMLGTSWLLVLALFMGAGWVADKWARGGASPGMQYLGLFVGVVSFAVVFLPLLAIAISHSDPTLLPQAAITTLIVFGGLSAVVLITRQDFSILRTGLSVVGFLAMGAIVAGILFGFNLGLGFSIVMISLASGCVVYRTSDMLHVYRTDQHVAASLALFSAIALMFWYILQIFMMRR